jgi:hypothetical protein
MNRPEHYRAAEYLLSRSTDTPDTDEAAFLVASAAVHATLALAAATAIPAATAGEMAGDDCDAWEGVAMTPKAGTP